MPEPLQGASSGPPRGERFATTQWSLVVAAAGHESAEARGALETLCLLYWYPLYAFVRRQGHAAAQAEDLTQGFFAMLLERGDLAKASPERGRFRSFLLTALKHFLLNEQERERALKRGGGRVLLSLDFSAAEGRLARDPAAGDRPEDVFERQWALTLLDRVQQLLREEYTAAGKEPLIVRLQGMLAGDGLEGSYAEAARDLGMTEGAVKTAVFRLRKRFGERLREEISRTVADPGEIDDEIRELFDVLRK